ncbi:hypothetical protein C0991_006055 [Blastosporella zonata]|nr:hypothetical protein C0991_006055 [Blastosporella zonata]
MPAGNNAEFGLGGRGSANKDPSSQTDKISSFKTMTPPLKPTIPPLKTMTPPPKPTIPPPKPMTPPPKPSSPPPKPMTPPPPSPRKLTLYTNHLTPNGLKASIYLEELCALKELSFQYE